MPDNVEFEVSFAAPPVGTIVATDEVTYSGDTSKVQIVQLASVTGVEGSKTIEKIEGTAAFGMESDVTRIASAASPDIGAVADAAVVTDTTGSLSGKLRGLVKWAFERMPASLGQKLMTASLPVVLASDQAAIPVTMASAPTGGATAANQSTIIGHVDGIEGLLTTIDADTGTIAGAVAGSEMQVDIVSGTVTANAGTGTFTTKETRASTATTSSVNDTASSTTLLAANANRLGATVYNDSTVDLYLKLGATASTSSFTVKMAAGSYYEVPFSYTGIIDGIWSSDASGSAKMTEVSA